MKVPSDAQAAVLALIAECEAAGDTVEFRTDPPDDPPSRAALMVERIDREKNKSTFDTINGDYRGWHRRASVEACIRHGWLQGLHTRTVTMRWRTRKGQRHSAEWSFTQLDTTEDGTIALGLWRERKLKAPPSPLPELSDREREVIELAQRALDLGYALCPRKPARLEVRRMRRKGWLRRGGPWVANSPTAVAPTAMALVEVLPDRADAAPFDEASA